MNKLGMLIDAAHCGDQTTLDIIEASDHPIVISHAGARMLWNTRRLKPNHVLEAMAAKGACSDRSGPIRLTGVIPA
jgi:membrane dipeptidase